MRQVRSWADQEKWKRAENPFEAYTRLKTEALAGIKPKPDDNFRWRYHGLFYVAPAQDSYMCRLRIANGILKHWQFVGVADIAERLGGGFTHVTTRANLQIREIKPENGPAVVEDLTDIGIVSRGSGADNIRNVTGSATAGIDPHELHDTRADARAWHHHILNTREMYGLPRKFNVAFDGGGAIATLEDTNDIGFQAVDVAAGSTDRAGAALAAGIWYRLMLGGISGHQDFARDTGVILPPADATRVADAVVRVFIANGDRTDRNKARLKYVLDAWGFDKFLAEVETVLGTPLTRIDAALLPSRPAYDRLAHIGVHPQRQPGLNWIGIVLPTGKMTCDQMKALAAISLELGDGDIRLTVWQNLLISGVPDAAVAEAKSRIEAAGLGWQTTPIRAGLIACTGNRGCKFAASDTKGHALAIAEHCDTRVDLDQPINIHLTGCHNSCAQHYIGDIGLIGAKVMINEEGGPGGGLPPPRWRRLWDRRRHRPIALFGREGRGRSGACGTAAQGLSWQPRRAGGRVRGICAPHRAGPAPRPRRRGAGMTVPIAVPRMDLVPESAPFSDEQRVWLSGFFAAALGPIASPEALSNAALAGLGLAGDAPAGPVLATNDEAPWHDPALVAPDRMKMAEGRPLAPRLMAAMAQQDCGQCGYNCADYANAIFLKNEKRLNLCAPGGKETARLVKGLAVELDGAAEGGSPVEVMVPAAEPGSKPMIALGTSREAPGEATFLSRRKLNGEGSEKETMHIEFDLGPGLHYEVGDSFGIFPKNDVGHVDQIIALLGAAPRTEIRGRTLRDVLTDEVAIGLAPDALYELFSYVLGGQARETARALARGDDPQGDAATLDVLAVLHKFPAARPHAEAFVDALEPLQPRLYSISSSPKSEPGRLTLTVDSVRYVVGKRRRLGVASTYLGERAIPGDRLRAYVQKAHNFALPADPNTPVIMVGPGTGIAPFRAFLHERKAIAAPGPNWLFFGHQRQATDFFYRDELQAMQASGHLGRLSLAWSRDGDQKFYVQDRMREVGATLWQWFEQGAHFYVCGDAKRMAKDVEGALVDIATQYGGRAREDAVAFVAQLKKAGRYQADVY